MTHEIPPCTPHTSPFTWGLDSGRGLVLLNDHIFGTLAETLADHATFVESVHIPLPDREKHVGGKWEWAVVKGKKKRVWLPDPPKRYIHAPATWMNPVIRRRNGSALDTSTGELGENPESRFDQDPLCIVAQSCGLRRLTETSGWRMCAPNAVLHPQMGPCVTMCTDGVHVVLWDKPWPGTSWLMAHVTNITGPVTSTPTALWEWCSGAASPTAKPKLSPLQLAIQQLEKALKVA